MKNEQDDRIQELAEQLTGATPLSTDEQVELDAYRQLFAMLNKTDVDIPHDFSVKIVARVQAKLDRKKNIPLYCLTGLLIACSIILSATIITSEMLSEMLDVFYRFRWIGVFTIVFFLIIHFADAALVKRKKMT